jgi:hypothetical protein
MFHDEVNDVDKVFSTKIHQLRVQFSEISVVALNTV